MGKKTIWKKRQKNKAEANQNGKHHQEIRFRTGKKEILLALAHFSPLNLILKRITNFVNQETKRKYQQKIPVLIIGTKVTSKQS